MFYMEYTTVNNNAAVLVPIINISHIIEGKQDENNSSNKNEQTCWIQFMSGKSIHVTTSYDEIAKDLEDYYKSAH